MTNTARNLVGVLEFIRAAEREFGRAPGSVALVAVSKGQSLEAVREAAAAGQRDFGENYVQELLRKREELADLQDVRWHVIGHVQTNKARDVAPVAAMVHTLDSARLAAELGRRAIERITCLAPSGMVLEQLRDAAVWSRHDHRNDIAVENPRCLAAGPPLLPACSR